MVQIDESEKLLLQQRKLQLLRRKQRLQKECGIAFYRPHEKQDLFHSASWARRRMIAAGNRFGKSLAGAAEDCGYFMGERLWYAKSDPRRTLGIPPYPTKGIVVCADWGKVDSVFTGQGQSGNVGKLWKLLPADFVTKTKKSSNGVIDYLEGANGSIIRFETVRSFKQDAMSAESDDWDWAHYDEPVPIGLREAIARGGMDRGMKEWYTMTPRQEVWIYDLFFPRQGATGIFNELSDGVFQSEDNRSWAVRASTTDNPHLCQAEIDDFIATLSPDELECRINGLPLELAGLVYKEFRYETHVLSQIPQGWSTWNTPPPEDFVLYMAVDVHFRKPHAVTFCFVNRLEQCFIAQEIFEAGTIAKLCELIKSRAAPYRCAPIKCDPLAWTPDPNTGFCMAHEFVVNGVPVVKASKAREFGILQMRQALTAPNYLFISPNLKRTIFEFNNYIYADNGQPKKENDDMMENLYRIFINRPLWFDESNTSVFDQLEIAPDPIDPYEHADIYDYDEELLEV